MLKFQIANLNEVPAPLREHYTAKEGGGFQLALDSHPDSERLAEFRTSNVALAKERDALKTKFDGIDPEAVKTDRAKLAQLEAAKPDAKVAELETQLAAERAARSAAEATAGASVLKNAVTAAFIKFGGKPKAADFIVAKAAEVFTVKDGAVTTSKFSPLRPGEPLTLEDFMVVQATEHDFAFAPTSGGGARHSGGGLPPSGNDLIDPDARTLGARAADIAAGRVKVHYTS